MSNYILNEVELAEKEKMMTYWYWNKADRYHSIAPGLHKQPFQNGHQFTSRRGEACNQCSGKLGAIHERHVVNVLVKCSAWSEGPQGAMAWVSWCVFKLCSGFSGRCGLQPSAMSLSLPTLTHAGKYSTILCSKTGSKATLRTSGFFWGGGGGRHGKFSGRGGVYVLFMHTWQRLMCVRRFPAFSVVGTGFL